MANIVNGEPENRTVVLRSADPDTRILTCHVDLRSNKLEKLASEKRFSWLFYDRKNKTQLRAYGKGWIHKNDEFALERWNAGAWKSAQCYRTLISPGAPCRRQDLQLSVEVNKKTGIENFAVLACEIDKFDWLFLRAEGHLRAKFAWTKSGWSGEWIGA